MVFVVQVDFADFIHPTCLLRFYLDGFVLLTYATFGEDDAGKRFDTGVQ